MARIGLGVLSTSSDSPIIWSRRRVVGELEAPVSCESDKTLFWVLSGEIGGALLLIVVQSLTTSDISLPPSTFVSYE